MVSAGLRVHLAVSDGRKRASAKLEVSVLVVVIVPVLVLVAVIVPVLVLVVVIVPVLVLVVVIVPVLVLVVVPVLLPQFKLVVSWSLI
jgi:hypothetical protein